MTHTANGRNNTFDNNVLGNWQIDTESKVRRDGNTPDSDSGERGLARELLVELFEAKMPPGMKKAIKDGRMQFKMEI